MMELTDDQKKGLEMMVRVLSKKYPFIIDASPNILDLTQYTTILTIKIIMSKSKLEDYFKKRVKNEWDEFWRFSNIFYPNPDPEELIIPEIKTLGAMFYESITEEYQFKSGLSTRPFRRVKINSFSLQ
jgi:hypothetical protein